MSPILRPYGRSSRLSGGLRASGQVSTAAWWLGTGAILLGLSGLGGALPVHAEPEERPIEEVAIATSSVAVEQGLEALLREQAIPPSFFPEVYTSFPQAVPPPIVGGLHAEIE